MSDEQAPWFEVLKWDDMGSQWEDIAWRKKVEPVPWCETHDQPMLLGVDECYPQRHEAVFGPCRLQDPPKVWRER